MPEKFKCEDLKKKVITVYHGSKYNKNNLERGYIGGDQAAYFGYSYDNIKKVNEIWSKGQDEKEPSVIYKFDLDTKDLFIDPDVFMDYCHEGQNFLDNFPKEQQKKVRAIVCQLSALPHPSYLKRHPDVKRMNIKDGYYTCNLIGERLYENTWMWKEDKTPVNKSNLI